MDIYLVCAAVLDIAINLLTDLLVVLRLDIAERRLFISCVTVPFVNGSVEIVTVVTQQRSQLVVLLNLLKSAVSVTPYMINNKADLAELVNEGMLDVPDNNEVFVLH